jgi:hypothetical protein
LWLRLVKSLQKWPVNLADGRPGTDAALLAAGVLPPPPDDEEEEPAVLPPADPPPHALSKRQAPAAAAIAETRGVDLMASMSCLPGDNARTGVAADGSVVRTDRHRSWACRVATALQRRCGRCRERSITQLFNEFPLRTPVRGPGSL